MCTLQEATDPDVAAKMAVDAWNAFSSVPVGKSQCVIQCVQNKPHHVASGRDKALTILRLVMHTHSLNGRSANQAVCADPLCCAVAKVLDTADPVTKIALNSFYKLHDSLVVGSNHLEVSATVHCLNQPGLSAHVSCGL
jgi:hypothetical protein